MYIRTSTTTSGTSITVNNTISTGSSLSFSLNNGSDSSAGAVFATGSQAFVSDAPFKINGRVVSFLALRDYLAFNGIDVQEDEYYNVDNERFLVVEMKLETLKRATVKDWDTDEYHYPWELYDFDNIVKCRVRKIELITESMAAPTIVLYLYDQEKYSLLIELPNYIDALYGSLQFLGISPRSYGLMDGIYQYPQKQSAEIEDGEITDEELDAFLNGE